MPGITAKVYDNIGRIPQAEWEEVFGNIPENYSFYRVLENSGLTEFKFFYLVVYCDNRVLLIAPLFSTDFNLDIAAEGVLAGAIKFIRRFYPRFLISKTLFCGSPFSECGVLGIRQGLLNDRQVAEVLYAELKKLAIAINAPLLIFKDFPDSARPLLDNLLRNRFLRVRSFPSVRVDLNFKSFEEYTACLGASTRKSLSRKLRQSAGLGQIEIRETANVEREIDQVFGLYENAYHGGSTKFERLTREFFLQIGPGLAPHARFFLYYVDNKLAAFNLCFIYDDLFIDKFIGFDYDVSNRYHLYFVSWAHNIRWCIANRRRYYHPGQTDYEPKLRLGGKLIGLFAYLRHRNVFFNFMLKLLSIILNPANFDRSLKE